MSTPQTFMKQEPSTTPPSSFAEHPLTPPPTEEKRFFQVPRVLRLFTDIRAGKHIYQGPWIEFKLAEGEYNEIERQLRQNEALSGFTKDKIRYDYNGELDSLFVRMPTGVHELFVDGVEDAIRTQLKAIRRGTDRAALFAQKIRPARSTEIYFPVDGSLPSKRSKHEPDASFWHADARYPGVIIEVAYSQKKKRLRRLAEDYLLDSNANVRVVIGLDIEYGRKESRKATLSVWRTRIDGNELSAVQETMDDVFRDDRGNPTDHEGLRLQLKDFAYEELANNELGDEGRELVISTRQLCEYLDAAETMVGGVELLGEHSLHPGIKKRKRSETPPEEINSGDEARYVEQEERAAKRIAEGDSDYGIT